MRNCSMCNAYTPFLKEDELLGLVVHLCRSCQEGIRRLRNMARLKAEKEKEIA